MAWTPSQDDVQEMLQLSLTQWREGVKCPHCAYVGHSSSRLNQHLARVHQEETIFKCNLCDYTCKWNREYYKHMKSHFEGPPYKCQDCDYICDRIQFLLSHRMRHTDEKPFQCDSCPFKSRTKGNLIVHKRVHTGEKPYKCECCDKAFSIKNTLDQHLATHTDERPYQCETCGFSTKYQSHLLSHKRIHTGNVYRCTFSGCSYFSPRRGQLEAHTRSHYSQRDFICGTCGRGFIEKSHLIRHERIHLDEKPFKCETCDYASTRRDKLKEHVSKHHTGDGRKGAALYKARKKSIQKQQDNTIEEITTTQESTEDQIIITSPQEIDLSGAEQDLAAAYLVFECSDGLTPARVLIQSGQESFTIGENIIFSEALD